MRILFISIIILFIISLAFYTMNNIKKRLTQGFNRSTKILAFIGVMIVIVLGIMSATRSMLSEEEMQKKALTLVKAYPLIKNFKQSVIFSTEHSSNYYEDSIIKRIVFRLLGQQKRVIVIKFFPTVPEVICYLSNDEPKANKNCIETRVNVQLSAIDGKNGQLIALKNVGYYRLLMNRHGKEITDIQSENGTLGFGADPL